MFIKFDFNGELSIVELAKLCGIAPCQILAVNKCSEAELVGRIIDLPVSTPAMIRNGPNLLYKVGEDGRLTKVLRNAD